MELAFLSFVISYGAGIATDLNPAIYKILFKKDDVNSQIKGCFNKALEKWCPNKDIRQKEKERLIKIIQGSNNPEKIVDVLKSNTELQNFYAIFEEQLAKPNYQTAFNYLKSISDKVEFKNINSQLSEIIKILEASHQVIEKQDLEIALRTHLEKQLDKQINSEKYIPEIFIEIGSNRENLRYFSNPILFSKKIYHTLKNADFRILNSKKKKKSEALFSIEIEKLDLKISIENYYDTFSDWIKHLDSKHSEITNTLLSQNDMYPYESKIKYRLEDINYLKSSVCLITETAGQGKTNFISDFVNRFILGTNNPAVFLTGSEINPNDIRKTILNKVFPNRENLSFENFINSVEEICKERDQLFLIIIDGINENVNTSIFSKSLEDFINDILDYSYVKIIISCRKEYYDYNFKNIESSSFKRSICRLNSLGAIQNDELKNKLFDGYIYHFNIDYKSVSHKVFEQLMSNLLLLRIFCEAFANQNIGIVNNIYKEELFQKYYEKKLVEIEKRINNNDEFGVKPKIDIKQFLTDVIKYMVENNQYSNVPLDLIIKKEANREVYIRFLDENILIKRDPEIEKNSIFGNTEVVSFTFDEFRDFLLSKYLVDSLYPNEKFEEFISSSINDNSQILEGCGTFLFHFLRKMPDSEMKSNVYSQDWYNQIFIKSIFDVKDETVKDEEKKKVIELFNSSNDHCYQIVNNLMKRSKKSFANLNIEDLFNLIKGLDAEKYSEKFLSTFSSKYDSYQARFYKTIPIKEILKLAINKFEKEDFENDSKYHGLFQILLFLLPIDNNWQIKSIYERYVYKYIDKGKAQIKSALESKNIELVKEVKQFCIDYEISI